MIAKLKANAGLIVLALLSLVLIGFLASIALKSTEVVRIGIAAGEPKAESFILLEALKTVVERHYPRLRITVLETGGTTDSLQRLARGEAQLAAAQADVAAPAIAEMVAILFTDNFQLLVHKGSNIEKFADLKGKRIGMATSGGQYKSFLFVARHFGLKESDFTFVGQNDDAADLAFATDQADAVFRVRALHNASIARLTGSGNVVFVPIDDAAGMRIEMPAYTPGSIPKGAYLGNPPVPATELPTVVLQRNLLARHDVDEGATYAIAEVLMDRRQEVAAAIRDENESVRSLVADIKQPSGQIGLEPSVNAGALAYYERDKRSSLQSHAEAIVSTVTVLVLIWMWVWALKPLFEMRRRARTLAYNQKVLALIEEARSSTSDKRLEPIRVEMLTLLAAAVKDLGQHKISDESFQCLGIVLQVALDVVREQAEAGAGRHHHSLLEAAAAAVLPQNEVRAGADLETRKSTWSFGKLIR